MLKKALHSIKVIPLVILLLFQTAETGSSATIQPPSSGQTSCWDEFGSSILCSGTGQDGEKQAGISWPSPRFASNGDQSITDNLTGLIWVRDGNLMATRDPSFDIYTPAGDGMVIWRSATSYIKKLNSDFYLGHNDWRLPNVNELASLTNLQTTDSAKWLNSQGFTNVKSGSYWTSTTYVEYPAFQWSVSLLDSTISYLSKISQPGCYVWPVRGISNLPATGQTVCYDYTIDSNNFLHMYSIVCAGTGQDGEIQAGVVWPTPRFTNQDGTTPPNGNIILDKLTGLQWFKNGRSPSFGVCIESQGWQGALDYVTCLNKNSYLGYSDWRLPNVNELTSLLNRQYSSPATWLNSMGFNNIQAGSYSASNSYANLPSDAWNVYFSQGVVLNTTKSNITPFTIPVRSGKINITIPGAPNIVSTLAGNAQVTIYFTVPSFDGGSTINSYAVTSTPGNITANGMSSPITVTGLQNGTTYTFTVIATNSVGNSSASNVSSSVTPQVSVNGVCGSANGSTFLGVPEVGLCAVGTASNITDTDKWRWTCYGNSGGNNANCLANFSSGVLQLLRTGQTSCWNASGNIISCSDAGQDGSSQTGVTWPNPRFTDYGDQSIRDNLSGLTWAKNANLIATRDPSLSTNGIVTWQQALDYIKKLNIESYLGYNDWRLPNLNELASLINRQRLNSGSWLTSLGFTHVMTNSSSYHYLSSSTYVTSMPLEAWVVDFRDNSIFHIAKFGGYVWPVRGKSYLPITGQTGCWDSNLFGNSVNCAGTGQDGELQSGVPWPSPRFTNPDGTLPIIGSTVLDRLTGIEWAREGSTPNFNSCIGRETIGFLTGKSWQGALDYVSCLNMNSYLGHNDWRLPNVNELMSLINRQRSDSAAWLIANTQGFINVQSEYWSSTTIANVLGDDAWSVSFNGDVTYSLSSNNKALYKYVWPVRAGLSSTSVAVVPTISTGVATDITPTTATVNGSVALDGGATVTTRGICWSTFVNPNIGGSCTSNGAGIGTFAGLLSELSPATNYHVRAYAINRIGTVYGNDTTFSTQAILTLMLQGLGGGVVKSSKPDINCSTGACTQAYPFGANINLTPIAYTHSQFDGWSGECSGAAGTCSLTMDINRVILASFGIDPVYAVWVSSNNTFYAKIFNAYQAAATGCIIRACSLNFYEDLMLDQLKNVTISGGYNSDYMNNGDFTVLTGTLTVKYGQVIIEKIIIK